MSDPSRQIPYWFSWVVWMIVLPAGTALIWWIVAIDFEQQAIKIETQKNRERIERNYELIREDFLQQIRNRREEIEKTPADESN